MLPLCNKDVNISYKNFSVSFEDDVRLKRWDVGGIHTSHYSVAQNMI